MIDPGSSARSDHPSFCEAFRRWISERRFLHALNYCMVLPGPEAQQLAACIGRLLHHTWGGIVGAALIGMTGGRFVPAKFADCSA